MTIDSDTFSIRTARLYRSTIILGTAAAALAVAGCATTGAGPDNVFAKYPVVDLENADLDLINKGSVMVEPEGPRRNSARSEQLRPGDKIQVKIFDTGEQGLFSSADSKVLDLGVFQVDGYGYINVPYAGRLQASKMTVASLQGAIVRKLKGSSVAPQATVTVVETATSFTSFGGFKSPGEFKFAPGQLTLAQAVARSGGLLSERPNREKVFLLRHEPMELASSLGVAKSEDARPGTMTPVVYQVDMSQPQSFFVIQRLQMKKGDMLYVPKEAKTASMFEVLQKPPPEPQMPAAPSMPAEPSMPAAPSMPAEPSMPSIPEAPSSN